MNARSGRRKSTRECGAERVRDERTNERTSFRSIAVCQSLTSENSGFAVI